MYCCGRGAQPHPWAEVAQKGIDSFDLGKGRSSEKLASEGKIAGEWTAANQLAVFGTSHNSERSWGNLSWKSVVLKLGSEVAEAPLDEAKDLIISIR